LTNNFDKVLNTNSSFIDDIEKLCHSHGVDILDAAVTWCEKHNVEIETVAALIKRDFPLRARLQAEAEAVRTVRASGAKLPI
jgi:hypothetical protein